MLSSRHVGRLDITRPRARPQGAETVFKSDMMPRLSVRFPTDLHSWIADQSFEGHCSMNAVVVEAVQAFKVLRAGEGRGRKHAAAVSLAIASAHLARGTAMFTKSGEHAFETVLLVQYPGKGELTVYARILNHPLIFKPPRTSD